MDIITKQCVNFNQMIKYVFLFLIIGNISCESNDKLELTNNGASNYGIEILENASPVLKNASEDLQNYIEKISTVKLPIISVEGKAVDKLRILIKIEELGSSEISIRTKGDNIIISGGSVEAVQNAIYEFIEKYLNVKWYAPNVEVVPSNKSIVLHRDINYRYSPEILTRTVHSRLFYQNLSFAAKHKVTTTAFPFYVSSARVHTFNKFLPEEEYYKSHPEYFALRGDKRLPTQLCLTNEKVYEIVTDEVGKLFLANPESSVISVSQNDNQQYCTCDNCKQVDREEGSQAGTMVKFVNKIAADFPEKTISTLAYQYTRKPCKTKPLENVLITLCSIECDRSASIEEKCSEFADDIRGWREITTNIRVWDYTTQFTNFLGPFPNMETLQPNIKFFRDNNAKWIFEQHSNNPSELFELRSYITAKLLWNPDRDFNELVTEFTNGYYEEAGVFVKQYVDLVHQKIKEDPDFFLFLYGDPSQAFDSYLNPELLKKYDIFFEDAEKAVKNKPEVLERVKVARISVDYAILEACKKSLSKEFSMVLEDDNGLKSINKLVIERLEKFYSTCFKADLTLMNEMGFTVDEYYQNYKKSMQVATQPNKAIGKKVILLTKPKKYANEDPKVLTDGALGGNSFYANWLGFEGNNFEAVIDLGAQQDISSISTAFLQVTNHVVFFPEEVSYYYSNDNVKFMKLKTIKNDKPLIKKSKVNDIKYFPSNFPTIKARYTKIVGKNMKQPPYWHHAAGTPAWIFVDEVIIN
jgi:hypothetical protein